MCFGTAAFDTNTFQNAILYQKEGSNFQDTVTLWKARTFKNFFWEGGATLILQKEMLSYKFYFLKYCVVLFCSEIGPLLSFVKNDGGM